MSLEAWDLFSETVRQSEDSINLAKAALTIAKLEYPNLKIEEYLAKLHQLGEGARKHVGDDHNPPNIICSLSRYLFEEESERCNNFGG